MKHFKTVLFVLCFSFLAACQSASETKSPADRNASNSVSAKNPNNTVAANSTALPEVKTFQGSGVVTEVRPETGEIELDHEEIKGLMPAMRMMFHVKNKEELKGLKPGDRVDFTLEDKGGAEIITKVSKR